METPSKRKQAGNVHRAAAAPLGQSNTRTHDTSLLKATPPEQSTENNAQDLLQTLPPEIRNIVYELALVTNEPFHLRFHEEHELACGSMTVKNQRKPLKRGFFTEPGLLRAAKWVRQEALSIFDQRNDFIVAVTMKDFLSAYRWMLNIAASCAKKIFGLSYFYVKGVNWEDLGVCIGLAKMIHELDLPVKANQASNRTGLARLSAKRRSIIKVGPNGEHIKAALRRIEKLGFKAKAAGWSDQMLEQELRALLGMFEQENKRRTGFVLCGS